MTKTLATAELGETANLTRIGDGAAPKSLVMHGDGCNPISAVQIGNVF